MQSISTFLDITKIADFPWKSADVSRTQELCHMIYMFFGSSLGKVYLCQVSSLQDMCDRFREGGLSASPIREQLQKGSSWIGLNQNFFWVLT